MSIAPGVFVDRENQLIIGWCIISEIDGAPYFNAHNTYIPADQPLLKAAMDFAVDRDARILLNHDGEPIGTLLFCWPMTAEIAAAMGCVTRATGVLVGIRADPALLDRVERGEIGGLSPHVVGASEEEVFDDA